MTHEVALRPWKQRNELPERREGAVDDRIADRWYEAVTVTFARPPTAPVPLVSPVAAVGLSARAAAGPSPAFAAELSPPAGPAGPAGSGGPANRSVGITAATGPVTPRVTAAADEFGPTAGDPRAVSAGMRAELRELTGQLLGALAVDPVDRAVGQAVGARLARIGFADPDALARTVEVLGPPLSAAAGPGRAPAAFAMLGAVASGHGDAVRKRALATAEDKHRAELAGLRRAERTRRLADRRFRSIFQQAEIGTLVVADSGSILESNETARAIAGRDLTRMSIGDVWDLVPARDRAGLIDMWAAVRAGRPGHGVWRLNRPAGLDDGELWVSLTAAMVDDEAAVGGAYYAVTIEDVTNRHDPRSVTAHGGPGHLAPLGETSLHGDPAGQPEKPGGDGGDRPGFPRGSARPDFTDPGGTRPAPAATAFARRTRSIAAALRAGHFVVHYQPIVRLADGTIQGAEALVRWDHPRLGMLFPEEFISVAEESGLIVPLGLHVLETACLDAASWAEVVAAARGGDLPGPFVSVNLSVRQLEEPDLVPTILDIVKRTGLDPRRLQLELVENLMIDTAGRQPESLRQLAEAGIRIAIDDFGTGYSNFAYLPKLPVRALKLAGQFCAEDASDEVEALDERDAAASPLTQGASGGALGAAGARGASGAPGVVVDTVVRPALSGELSGPEAMDRMIEGIVSIAHQLGHVVTAEAVETAEQAARMLTLGADLGQGHYFGRPMCADKMAAAFAATAETSGAAAGSTVAAVPTARDGHGRHSHRHAAHHRS